MKINCLIAAAALGLLSGCGKDNTPSAEAPPLVPAATNQPSQAGGASSLPSAAPVAALATNPIPGATINIVPPTLPPNVLPPVPPTNIIPPTNIVVPAPPVPPTNVPPPTPEPATGGGEMK
jgi:hypothetical protein